MALMQTFRVDRKVIKNGINLFIYLLSFIDSGGKNMSLVNRQRWYMVSEDLKYFRQMFKQPSGSANGDERDSVSSEFLVEFLKYSDYVEKEFNYSFVVKKFPKVYLEELLV